MFFASAFVFHLLYKLWYFNLDRLEKVKSKNPEAYKRALHKLIEEKESGWFPCNWLFSGIDSEKLKLMHEESENRNDDVLDYQI